MTRKIIAITVAAVKSRRSKNLSFKKIRRKNKSRASGTRSIHLIVLHAKISTILNKLRNKLLPLILKMQNITTSYLAFSLRKFLIAL